MWIMSEQTNQDELFAKLEPINRQFQYALQLAQQGQIEAAMNAYFECLKLAALDSIPLHARLVASILINVGFCHADLGNWQQAFYHYQMAEGVLTHDEAMLQQVADRYQMSTIFYFDNDDLRPMLAELYNSIGLGHNLQNEWEQALAAFRNAFTIEREYKDYAACLLTLNYIGMGYQQRNMWKDLDVTARQMLKVNKLAQQPHYEMAARRYLAQVFGNTERPKEMLAQLEAVVKIGKSINHPDVGKDEALFQNMKKMAAAQKSAPVPSASRPMPTDTTITQIPSDFIDYVSIRKGKGGEPAFVLHTRYFDQAQTIFRLFPVGLRPVNIWAVRQYVATDAELPDDGVVYIEFLLDDLNPGMLLNTVVINETFQHTLGQANYDTKKLTVMISDTAQRVAPVPGTFTPYFLDWSGMVGIATYMRKAGTRNGQQPSQEQIKNIIHILDTSLQEHGPATGKYCELGYLYRLLNDWQQAIQYYTAEINLNRGSDGLPMIGGLHAFNHMGMVYQKARQFDVARDCYRIALALNPNYFDCLISLAGITEDSDEAMRYVARAHRIRPNDPIWPEMLHNLAQASGRPEADLRQMIIQLSRQVDLATRNPVDRALLRRLGL